MTSTPSQIVLVVDDDPMLLDLLTCYIEYVGCQAVATTDGNEAIRLARDFRPALVLCDLTMPCLSGLDVFRALQADPETAEVPFALMSGDPSPNLRGARINIFLAKPFNMEEVQNLVRSFTFQKELSVAA